MTAAGSSFRSGRALVSEPSGQQYVGAVTVAGRVVSLVGHVRLTYEGQHGLEFGEGPEVDLTWTDTRLRIEWLR